MEILLNNESTGAQQTKLCQRNQQQARGYRSVNLPAELVFETIAIGPDLLPDRYTLNARNGKNTCTYIDKS